MKPEQRLRWMYYDAMAEQSSGIRRWIFLLKMRWLEMRDR